MLSVRRAGEQDAFSFAAIHLVALTGAMPLMPRQHTVEEDRKYLTHVLTMQNCWAVDVHNTIAGFIAFHDSWINHIYVLPQYQRIGIGSKLLEVAKGSHAQYLQLWTFQENHQARAFYGKHGFVEVELTDGAGNEERTPDVRLEWQVKPTASEI